MKLVTTSQMADIDAQAQAEGFPGEVLMENAGIRAHAEIAGILDSVSPGGEVLYIAGKGNNGGDALVMARQAKLEGRDNIRVLCIEKDGSPLFMKQLAMIEQMQIPVSLYSDEKTLESILIQADVIIDGISGTGIKGRLRAPLDRLVEQINSATGYVISIDVPSGIGPSFENGYPAVTAKQTITMGLPKYCLFTPLARKNCGRISVVNPSFPPALIAAAKPAGYWQEPGDLPTFFPEISRDTYKNKRGKLAVFAGAQGTHGASVLCSHAAARSLAGLVTLFIDKQIYGSVSSQCSSVMVRQRSGRMPELEGYHGLCAGPGWGKLDDRKETLRNMILTGLPGVIDADGLYHLKQLKKEGNLPDLGQKWVLTPHPGEFAYISSVEKAEVFQDPVTAVRKAAAEYNAVVVLKGHVTWVCTPKGDAYVIDGMNPAMATGGSGDILAGIIAGLITFGLSTEKAAVAGVLIHQLAGKRCFCEKGWFIAEEMQYYIGGILKEVL